MQIEASCIPNAEYQVPRLNPIKKNVPFLRDVYYKYLNNIKPELLAQ
jgi:hypothetical protein